jgi:hypothetical protein
MAYLIAHPTYSGDSSGFAQHVRWRALGGLFDTFSVLNDVRSHDENEQLRESTALYVDNTAGEGMLLEFEDRADQFGSEHKGWGVSWAGRSGGYFVLVPHHQYPRRWGYEDYAITYQRDLDGFSLEDLDGLARVVYDFDLVCMDIVYDVITEGYHQLWPERHVTPFGMTVR